MPDRIHREKACMFLAKAGVTSCRGQVDRQFERKQKLLPNEPWTILDIRRDGV